MSDSTDDGVSNLPVDEIAQGYQKFEYALQSSCLARLGDVFPMLGIVAAGVHIQVYAISWLDDYKSMSIGCEPLTPAIDISTAFHVVPRLTTKRDHLRHPFVRMLNALETTIPLLESHYDQCLLSVASCSAVDSWKKEIEVEASKFIVKTREESIFEPVESELDLYHLQSSIPFSPFAPIFYREDATHQKVYYNHKCLNMLDIPNHHISLEVIRPLIDNNIHHHLVFLGLLQCYKKCNFGDKRTLSASQQEAEWFQTICDKIRPQTEYITQDSPFAKVRYSLGSITTEIPSPINVIETTLDSSNKQQIDHPIDAYKLKSEILKSFFSIQYSAAPELLPDDGDCRKVVVKYVRRENKYPIDFHVSLSTENITPRLYFLVALPDDITMIVSEYLPPSDGWIDLSDFLKEGETLLCTIDLNMNMLLTWLHWILSEVIYKEYFERNQMVHGDLRNVNIMINATRVQNIYQDCQKLLCDENILDSYKKNFLLTKAKASSVSTNEFKVIQEIIYDEEEAYKTYCNLTKCVQLIVNSIRIVDLDWCGVEGVVCYPADLNEELFRVSNDPQLWPNRERLIESRHDREMIASLFVWTR